MEQNVQEKKRVGKPVLKAVLSVLLILVCAIIALAVAYPGYTVEVRADGRSKTITTKTRDPASIIEEAGVKMGKHDYIDRSHFKAGRDKEDGNKLEVLRAFPVEVQVDGTTKVGEIAKGTIQDALKNAGVVLGKYDIVRPGLHTAVQKGDKVKVTRVRYQNKYVEKAVPYETLTIDNPYMKVGQKKLEQHGRDGKKSVTYQETYVDGELTDIRKISENILVKPIYEVIDIGSRIFQKFTKNDFNVNNFNSSQVITGKATAYTAKPGALTASGVPAAVGRVAVDPKQIPYGTLLYVQSTDGSQDYGYAIAADTGGFVGTTDVTMDLYMNTLEECKQWGKRDVNIYIIRWGDGTVQAY